MFHSAPVRREGSTAIADFRICYRWANSAIFPVKAGGGGKIALTGRTPTFVVAPWALRHPPKDRK
jgi:hypothetical protein